LKPVEGQPADEQNGIVQGPVGDDGAEIIPGVANVQAVDDVLQPLTFVLKMNHVRLGEHGAAAGDTGRLPALQAQGDEIGEHDVDRLMAVLSATLIHGNGQTFGLLVDEGSRAGGAGAVRVEKLEFPAGSRVTDLHQGRVLAAHADNGPDVRPDVDRSQDLADDLEFVWRPHAFAQQLPVAACEGDACDAFRPEPCVNLFDERRHGLLHLSEMALIRTFVDDSFLLIDQNAVDTDRAGVDACNQLTVRDALVFSGWRHKLPPWVANAERLSNRKSKRRTNRRMYTHINF